MYVFVVCDLQHYMKELEIMAERTMVSNIQSCLYRVLAVLFKNIVHHVSVSDL